MEENIIEKLIGKKEEYKTLLASNHKNGTGSNLSVKVVLPTYCQARCPFCFNNLTKETQMHDFDMFFNNLLKSLDMILDNINERKVTLDITGNEPTYNIDKFKEFMEILKSYKDRLGRVILTTNGYNLNKCMDSMTDIVNIVNFSVHHYDYLLRKEIFNTSNIPNDEELKEIVNFFDNYNIKSTAVAVLYKKIDNFMSFYDNFVSWSKDIGFKDIRFRSNFYKDDDFFKEILSLKFDNQTINNEDALITKIVKDNNFEVRFLKGVDDLTKYVIGAELVIDDDGMCYIDYNKINKVNNDNINYFNKFYVIDNEKKRIKKIK